MTGIDEESALLKKVRAHLCVKRKKLTDEQLSDYREAMLARSYANMNFAYVN